MPTVARLTLQVDVDGAAESRAQLEAIDRLLKSRADSWQRLASQFVGGVDDENVALRSFAKTGEDSHSRVRRAADDDTRSHSRFGGMLGVVGQQMTRISARATIFANALIPLATAGFQVGAALTPLVGLAGALPALWTAAGTAVGTVKLAFAGMGDALKAMNQAQDGSAASAKKLKEAMDALPPSARPVVRQLFEMRGMVAALRETAAAGIMPGVSAVLTSLRGLFPIVRREIGQTATVMGQLARGMAAWFESPMFRRDFRTLLGTSSSLTRNFGNAALLLARAFLDVAVAGQPLARQFGGLVEQGARWVAQATRGARASGDLSRFFQRAGDTAETLFGIVSDLVTIILNLGRAAAPAGSGLLDMLAGLLDRAARATRNIERLRAALRRVGDAFVIVRTAMLGVAFGPWGVVVGAAAGALLVLYRRSEAFRNVVQQVAGVIGRNALPIFRSLSGWFTGTFLPAIQRTIPFVRDQLAAGFSNVSRALRENRGEFGQVGRIIVQVAGWILTRLVPVLIRLYAVYLRSLLDTIATAIRVFGFLVRAIGAVVGVVVTVGRRIGEFVAAVARAWAALQDTTRSTFARVQQIITTVTAAISRAWNAVLGVSRSVWGFIRALVIDNIIRVRNEVVKSIVGLIPRQVRDGWNSASRFTSTIWGNIRRTIADLINRIRDNVARFIGSLIPRQIRDAWNTASRSTREAWDTMRRWVSDGTRRALETIRGWGRSVGSFFSGIIRSATGWGRDMWRNVRQGIASIDLAGVARGAVNRVINTVNAFGRAFARGANIILPGSPIQWPGIPQLRQAGGVIEGRRRQVGGLIPGLPRGDRVPVLAEGGEVMIRQPVAAPLRNVLLAINRMPASAARALARELQGIRSRPDIGGDPAMMILARGVMSRPDRQGTRVRMQEGGEIPWMLAQRLQAGGAVALTQASQRLIAQTQNFIRAQDPKPYVWGATGPGAWDCSGLAGGVYGMLTGQSPYRRYFTTASIPAGTSMRPGRGTYTIGVTPGAGHMAGNLAGLAFEARGRASGVLTGGAARSVTSFARNFYLPSIGGRFIGGGGGIDFMGLVSRLLTRLTAPLRAGISRAVGSGPNDLIGSLISGMGNNLVDKLANWISGGIGMQWGGNITEPIVGMGRRSGQLYNFGERGAIERYTPGGAGGGSQLVAVFQPGAFQLTGTYAQPLTLDDVHNVVGLAMRELRVQSVKGDRVRWPGANR